MTSPLENLSGPGQPLQREAPDAAEFTNLKKSGLKRLADAEKPTDPGEYEGDLYVDERLLSDLIRASKIVAGALEGLPALREST